MIRLLKILLLVFALVLSGGAWSGAAWAKAQIHFQSFNGSVLWGRYPHTFVVIDGTLDSGKRVNENYGFSAKVANAAALRGPVEQIIQIEKPEWIPKTNRHFSVTITDAQYARIHATVDTWRDSPSYLYDLKTRNCIHFVGTLAQIVGLKVDYPSNMLRRPKKWLNHIAAINPQLGAKPI